VAVVIRCPECKTKFRWLAETESYPSNCPECDFKTGHDRADNDVVVPNILAFSTRATDGVYKAMERAGSSPRESWWAMLGPLPSLDLTGIDWAIIGGESGTGFFVDAEIDTEEAANIGWIGGVNIAVRSEVKVPVIKNQIRFALSGFQKFKLFRPALERNALAPGYGPDRNRFTFDVPRENTVIVRECAVLPEGPLHFAIQFVGVCDLADTAHRHLGGQAEPGPEFPVAEFLNRRGGKHVRLEADRCGERRGFVKRLHRREQLLRLGRVGQQFDLNG